MSDRQAFTTGGQVIRTAKDLSKLADKLWQTGLELTATKQSADKQQFNRDQTELKKALALVQTIAQTANRLKYNIIADNNLIQEGGNDGKD